MPFMKCKSIAHKQAFAVCNEQKIVWLLENTSIQ